MLGKKLLKRTEYQKHLTLLIMGDLI